MRIKNEIFQTFKREKIAAQSTILADDGFAQYLLGAVVIKKEKYIQENISKMLSLKDSNCNENWWFMIYKVYSPH